MPSNIRVNALPLAALPSAGDYIVVDGATTRRILLTNVTRQNLQANQTYNVPADFATIQAAVNFILASINLNGFNVSIQVAAGTYTGGVAVAAPWTGAGTVTITGDTATPANCILSVNGNGVVLSGGGRLSMQGFKYLTTAASGGSAVIVQDGCTLYLGNSNFGACDLSWLFVQHGGSVILFGTAYSMSGNCPFPFYLYDRGGINFSATQTWTLTGNITVSVFATSFFASVFDCHFTITTWTLGAFAVTGQKYQAWFTGAIQTAGGGIGYLPGSVAGAGTNPGTGPNYGLYN